MKTFPRGIHPDDNKELARDIKLTNLSVPELLYISTSQHLGAPAEVVVSAGDTVEMGQLIARASGAMSSNIFSSVSGMVERVVDVLSISGRKEKTIIIKNDFKDTPFNLPKLSNPTPERILERVRDAGIVGMGGAGFPTAVKLAPPKGKVIDTLLINGAECEPYITCDHRLMLEYAKEVIEGAQLLAKALSITKIVICVEANKLDAVEVLNKTIASLDVADVSTETLEVKYPQGAERQLIFAATGRVLKFGQLPFDVGVIVSNVHTAYSTYLAVVDGQTLYQRAMTVSGRGIKNCGNFFVRIGTQFSHIIKECGGEVEENGKAVTTRLISGGPMMGMSASHDGFATTKTTSSLLLLTESESKIPSPSNCINCARCSKVCPMGLMPMYIDNTAMFGEYENAKRYGALECIECGSCSYVCPAKRPLVQAVKLAKKTIKEKNI